MFSVERGLISPVELLSRIEDYEVIKNNKKFEYYNIPAAFDIEVSSFREHEEKRACMYIWMFGINNLVTYGRTWEELDSFLKVLSTVLGLDENRRLCVYVHNLSYEFQFIRKRFDWNEVFLLEERKPAYCRTGGYEFRCSMKLAGGKSLESVGKDLQKYKVEKKVGDLDYDKVRHSETPLTEKELGYCENDIRVLLSYIQEKIETDGDITKIPLTNTGYVRNYCRKACFKSWRRYKTLMKNLEVEPDEYGQLKRAFQGGFTHANAKYVGKVIENVASFDLTSSYPTVMVLEKFPMSKGRHIGSVTDVEQLLQLMETKCCMFNLEVTNLRPRLFQDNPISASKCQILERHIENNGRVVFADRLKITCTEQDLYIYAQFYDWDEWEITDMVVYDKAYLPRNFVKSILKLYKDKTQLKGLVDQTVNYMISKNMINAAYGMIVTDINRKEFDYVDDAFITSAPNLESNIEKYNKSMKRFLYYPWGVWVTAYARANLFSAIIELGDDYIYSDTDSVKFTNYEKHLDYFKNYGETIMEKISDASTFHRISVDEFSPQNKNGKKVTIGLWDFEGVYDKFKTLGAKRYLVQKDGKFSLTVAGVNKKSACKYLEETGDPFKFFTKDLVIPADYSKRNVLTYIDDETSGLVCDYNGVVLPYREMSSIHMESTEYSFSLSDQFIKFLKGVQDFSE